MRKTQEAYLKHTQKSATKLREAAETIQSQNVSLEQANRLLRERSTAAMESLSATVDARDSYTAGHSRRVQQLSLAIGRELGLSQAELDLLGHAALFHDIGKLAIPDAILLKPASLTAEEWALMQRHAEEGARIIDRLGFLQDAVPAIRHHHERFDGTGYPDRLAGEEIPLGARIIHVADALDSMLTTRIYRAARPVERGARRAQEQVGLAVLPALRAGARAHPAARVDRRRPAARGADAAPRARRRRLVAPRRFGGPHGSTCGFSQLALPFLAWPDKPRFRAVAAIDPAALADFQAGIRKRYSDEQILAELRASAERLGRSPTMREFAADEQTTVHPQTVIEHFGSWNAAKRVGRARPAPLRHP